MAEVVEKVPPEAVEKVPPDVEERVEVTELERVNDSSIELSPTITSFAFSWLISRLAGTLPRLVDTVEVDNKIDPDAFPLLFFSDCVPLGLMRSFSWILLSPTSGAKSNAAKLFAVDTGDFSNTTLGLQDLPGATL